MAKPFNTDAYPGRPRVLFVGLPLSSHTRAWIDLLADAELNVRLFALPAGKPPADWSVKAYVTAPHGDNLDPAVRASMWSRFRAVRLIQIRLPLLVQRRIGPFADRWLASVIRSWRPHVIHTFGVNPSGDFYFPVREKYGLEGIGKWVAQLRGGSDVQLVRHDPEGSARLAELLTHCDHIITDNRANFDYLAGMGVPTEKIVPFAPVPGSGGVDVDALRAAWQGPPSTRRVIVWPKAYECPWSKALPVMEALRACWQRLTPCTIHMLAMNDEARAWYWTLPEGLRQHCRISLRIPREEMLALTSRARVMLVPSLVDGRPNSMLEAMAAGAFPIVSPLDSIREVVNEEENVLFAGNLNVDEIARALVRAMSDDGLVDRAAEANLSVVRQVADRAAIRPRVIDFYEQLARSQQESNQS